MQPCWLLVAFFLFVLLLGLLPILTNIVKAQQPIDDNVVCAHSEGRFVDCQGNGSLLFQDPPPNSIACEIASADGHGQKIVEDCLSIDYHQGTISTPCQRKMEAAMRAMEPFLAWNPYIARDQQKNGDSVLRWHAAIDQWEAVKAECWVKP